MDQSKMIQSILEHLGLPKDEYNYPQSVVKGYQGKKGDGVEHYSGRDAGWKRYPKQFAQVREHYVAHNLALQNLLQNDSLLEWNGWMARWGKPPPLG